MNGDRGTPIVTMSVHIPMNLARSCLKNTSCTTPLPIAAAGEMKNATNARLAAIEAYVLLSAHPMLQTRLQIREAKNIGRRPNRFDKGSHINGAPPRIAICSEVIYDAFWMLTSRSKDIDSNAGMTLDAVKVPTQA